MPSNIAHLLICHKTFDKIRAQNNKSFTEFVDLIETKFNGKDLKPYLNLGSIGPDLFYYMSLSGGAKNILMDNYSKARGVEPWSYHLHSIKPNTFPSKLIEIVFRDATRENDELIFEFEDYAKLAFIAGYLTHIAADQIIHPIINKYSGSYYRSGENRQKHRECEIYQDYFLYAAIYKDKEKTGNKYNFMKQNFNEWADCVTGFTTRNTEDWFRSFIQRGFAETYNFFPNESVIESSVDNLLLTLRMCTTFGPYKKAANDFEKNGANSSMYKDHIENLNYMYYYTEALELSTYYIMALHEVFDFLLEHKNILSYNPSRFLSIISKADLTCPLQHDILKHVKAEYENRI